MSSWCSKSIRGNILHTPSFVSYFPWGKGIWLSDKKGALQLSRWVADQDCQDLSAAENILVYTLSLFSLGEEVKGGKKPEFTQVSNYLKPKFWDSLIVKKWTWFLALIYINSF